MFSACAGVSSIASQTLAKRFLLIDAAPSITPDSVDRPDPDPPCVSSGSSSENSAARKRHLRISPLHHPEGSRGITYPDFLHALPDAIHGLPVVRLAPALHSVELISCFTAGRQRTRANPQAHCLETRQVSDRSSKADYTKFCIRRQQR